MSEARTGSNTGRDRVLRGRRGDLLGFLLAFVPHLAWSWRHAAPGLTFHDSGEFGLAAAGWGIPHPPGAPTWVLAAGFFVRLGGFDDPVRGTNLFSGLMAAVTLGLLVVLVRRWVADSHPDAPPGAGLLGGLGAAAVLAGTPAFLAQSVITEQYTLLTGLWTAVLLLATSATAAGPATRTAAWPAIGLLWGLACGNHLSQLVLGSVVVWAVVAASWPRRGRLLRRAALVGAGFLAGASVFAWMMWRARSGPLIDWGHVATPERLWWSLTRGDWATRALSDAPDGFGAAWLRSIDPWGELGPLALGLAGAGLGLLALRARGRLAWLLLTAVPYGLGIYLASARQDGLGLDYIDHYGVTDWHLPLYLSAAMAAGWALGHAAADPGRQGPARLRPAFAAIAVGVLVAVGLPAREAASLRGDARAAEYVDALLAPLPAGALVALAEADPAFMLGYARYARNRRPDLSVAYTRPGPGPRLAAAATGRGRWTARERDEFVTEQVTDPRRQPLREARPRPEAPLVTTFPREFADAARHLLPAGLLFRVVADPVDSIAVRHAEQGWQRRHGPRIPDPDPTARVTVREAWGRLHLHRAEYFTLFGLADLARAEAGRAVAWLPGHAIAWYNLGFSLARLGRLAEAEAALRRAVDLDPEVTGPRTILAQLALARGARAEAEALLREELTRHPEDPQARALAARLAGD